MVPFSSILLLSPVLVSAFDWSQWSSPQKTSSAEATTTATFFPPIARTPIANPGAITLSAFGNSNTASASVPGANTIPIIRTTATTQVAPGLAGGGFNLGVSTLCGKGSDGCGLVPVPVPIAVIVVEPARTVPVPLPIVEPPRIFGTDDKECGASGKGGKSKGYNGNNPNCCGESKGKKSKSNKGSGGSCGKSKGGKGKGKRGRSRTINYETLASAATRGSSWNMAFQITSLIVVASAFFL